MILYNDATSPFGRKVVVAALERRIPMREEFVDLGDAAWLDRHNPLRQIPVLVDGSRAVFDSDVILQDLDRLTGAARLFPAGDDLAVMTRTALANGLTEAVLNRLIETRRPAEQQSREVVDKLEERIRRAIAALEADADALTTAEPLRADQITAGCALGYADFRFSTDWRATAPRLADWYERLAQRPSFVASAPTRTSPAVCEGPTS